MYLAGLPQIHPLLPQPSGVLGWDKVLVLGLTTNLAALQNGPWLAPDPQFQGTKFAHSLQRCGEPQGWSLSWAPPAGWAMMLPRGKSTVLLVMDPFDWELVPCLEEACSLCSPSQARQQSRWGWLSKPNSQDPSDTKMPCHQHTCFATYPAEGPVWGTSHCLLFQEARQGLGRQEGPSHTWR